MNILVVNAGSSSLKYQLVNIASNKVLAKGLCERVGSEQSLHKHGIDENEFVYKLPLPDHTAAMRVVLDILSTGPNAVIKDMNDIAAVGHRIVHGGEFFKESALIDDDVISKIDDLAELAPLHNKAALAGINACRALMPETPMVAVFDTSFFQTLPQYSYMYPIPYEYYEKYGIRKYGFHGTSHRYLCERAAAILGEDLNEIRLITCHLGNGSSIAAIKDGRVVDTSMGFTPLDGFIMGTRSGGIDPSVVTYIMNKEGLTPDQMSDLMNKKSGFLGLSGVSSDCRDLWAAAKEGNERAKLTLEIVSYQIKKFIGSYAAAMGGVDAVIFTGGIGENDGAMRALVCEDMEFLGMDLDSERNKVQGEAKISTDSSKVEIWVIPTNEELLIARDTMEIVSKLK